MNDAARAAFREERQADRLELLKSKGASVAGFTLYVVGEGIEKKRTTSRPKSPQAAVERGGRESAQPSDREANASKREHA